jgi:peptide/nickel transport system permease protein
MGRFILRRLLSMLVVLLVISIATFGLMSAVLGDPALLILGPEGAADEATLERIRTDLGVDRPIVVQYFDWLRHVVTGDLGRSFRSPMMVREAIIARLPVTIQLTLMALALALAAAIPLGIAAALRPGSRLDVGISTFAVIGLSIPNFWLGILLIFLFALTLGWLPSAGFVPLSSDPLANLKLMILPSLTLATSYIGQLTRYTRSAMLDVLSQDYIRTAQSKGLAYRVVIYAHALRNALIPIVTVVGLNLAGLFGGAVVTETVFSLPGVGRLLVDSIFGRDLPMLQGVVLLITVAVVFTNLVTDIVYGFLDPRVRAMYG